MLEIQIKGLDAMIRKCRPELLARPLRNFFTRAAITVQNREREGVPVDAGQLRNDILYQVDDSPLPRWAKAGVLNAKSGSGLFKKAAAMEFGTGRFAEGPNAKGGNHWPPPAALQVWATRHGFKDDPGGNIWHTAGGKAAFAIGRAGGLKPRRYLRNALKESVADIQKWLAQLQADVLAEWEKR